MSIFDKLFQKKEEPRPRTLEEAYRTAKERTEKVSYEKEGELVRQIRSSIGEVFKELDLFEKAKMDPNLYKALSSAAKEGRSQLVMKIRGSLKSIELDEKRPLETYVSLNNALNHITKGSLKHAYYSGVVFKHEMPHLSKRMGDLARLSEQLKRLAEEKERELGPYKRIILLKGEKERLELSLEGLKKRLGLLESEKGKLAEEREKAWKRKEEFLFDKEASERLEVFERELEETDSRLYALVSPVSKALKSYERVGLFEKRIGEILKLYVDRPLEAALNDRGKELLKLLEKVDILFVKKELELKENQHEKVLEVVARIREGYLEELVKRHEKAEETIKDKEKEVKFLAGKKQKLGEELNQAEGKVKSLDSEEVSLKEKIGEKKKQFDVIEKKVDEVIK